MIQVYINGEIYNNSIYHTIEANQRISKNKLITQSLSYNGESEVLYIDGNANSQEVVQGNIDAAQKNTVMAIGANPNGSDYDSNASFANIDVYSIRIYNRGLTEEEIEVNRKADVGRFEHKTNIPIYTEEQLLKIGTGQQVFVEQENKTYTYAPGLKYELKNDITINGDYTAIIQKINQAQIEMVLNDYKIIQNGSYYTDESKYTIAVNAYGYVTDGLQLLLDGIDNTGAGTHSNNTTTWTDLSDNQRNGILTNINIENAWKDSGLQLDGIDDYVLIAEMNYDNFTLEVVNFIQENNGTNMHIISNIQAGGYDITQSTTNRFGCAVYIKENAAYISVPSTKQASKEVNKRYSVSGSYDGEMIKLRTSGLSSYNEIATTGTIGHTIDNTCMVLGANPKGTQAESQYFNGEINSVRIYNRALSDEEKAINYLNDMQRYGV